MRTFKVLTSLALCSLLAKAGEVLNILDFGAIPNEDSIEAEQANAQAFADAVVAANYTTDGSPREVHIPADQTFQMMASWFEGLNNITITIDGTV